MSGQTQKIVDSLYREDRTFADIVKTYKECSKDDANNRYLVDSEIKAINFDKLTERKAPGRKSADSLNFADGYSYLIEFKAGDQVSHERKREKLITGVLGKINDSGDTLFSTIYPSVFEETDYPKIRFYLVVDIKTTGVGAYADVLAELSAPALRESEIEKEKLLYEQVLPNLTGKTKNPERFDEIDIWYAELFDRYLTKHHISDISINAT